MTRVSQNCLKELFATIFYPLSLLLECSLHSETCQPDRVPGTFYNPQPHVDNNQPKLFLFFLSFLPSLCVFSLSLHGHGVGLLFQTNLYAKQQTAEVLLKPGTQY